MSKEDGITVREKKYQFSNSSYKLNIRNRYNIVPSRRLLPSMSEKGSGPFGNPESWGGNEKSE